MCSIGELIPVFILKFESDIKQHVETFHNIPDPAIPLVVARVVSSITSAYSLMLQLS